jgi:hypothetical protein
LEDGFVERWVCQKAGSSTDGFFKRWVCRKMGLSDVGVENKIEYMFCRAWAQSAINIRGCEWEKELKRAGDITYRAHLIL